MKYGRATEFKRVLDILEINRVTAEKSKIELAAIVAILNQLNICRVNTARFMTFKPEFYTKLYKLEVKLKNKHRMLVCGYTGIVDLDNDIFYLSAKVQINKIKNKFWFK